jgi:hypothetical protein
LRLSGCRRRRKKALDLLKRAVAIEAEYGAAHGFIAFCHENRYLRGDLAAEERLSALHHARIALATGVDDASARPPGARIRAEFHGQLFSGRQFHE